MQDDEDLLRAMKRSPRGLLGVAAVLVVVPFVLSFALNDFDFVKLGAGALACLLCVVAFVRAFKSAHRGRDIALSLVVLLVAMFHVVTSGVLGVVGFDPFGMSEADAREWLEARGDEVLALEHADERFAYTVIHDSQRCSGSLLITKSFSGTNTSNMETCGVSASDDEYRRECAVGRAASCMDLGLRLSESNIAEASIYFRMACDGGVGGACTNTGVALKREGNLEEAIAMAERGCAMGDGMGCGNLGLYLLPRDSEVSEEVAARAKGYLEQACTAGVFLACGNLAWELSFGQKLPRDGVRARELFAAACEGGIFTSCADLGVLFRDGVGGPVDAAEGLRYASRACEGGHFALSCRMVGEFLEGQSEGFNPAALAAFREACLLDQDSSHVGGACAQAGMHLYNHVDPKPVEEIVGLWTRACELNERNGCRNMGVLHRDGTVVPRNQAVATQFFQKSCELGFEPACLEPGVRRP